jgi:hypothetical protein
MKRLRVPWETRRDLRRQIASARAWAVHYENEAARLEAEANNLAEHIVRASTAHMRYVARVAGRIGTAITGGAV